MERYHPQYTSSFPPLIFAACGFTLLQDLSLQHFFLIHLYYSQLPPSIISSPCSTQISPNLLFVPMLSFSPVSCLLNPPSQPAPKMNSRWTTEEQLLAVQGK